MVFNRFRLNLVLHVAVLVGLILGLMLVLYRTDWYMTAFCIGLLVVVQLYSLVYYVERTNRDISSFMEAIRHSDFTQRFSAQGTNASYQELYQSFNDVTDAFQKIKSEKQAHYLYLQAIIEHIGIGVLSFDETGEVNLVNRVTKELLHVPFLKNVHALSRVSGELPDVLLEIGDNEKRLLTIETGKEQLLLTLHATTITSLGKSLKIVSLQNIRSEMEEQELQTWQKVIRVLTHEIMNSITPVISLTSTVSSLLDKEVAARYAAGETPDAEVLEDMQAGLQTIEKRSSGMLEFVKNYRKLMRVPAPVLQTVKLNSLLKQVYTLLQPEMEANQVKLAMYLPDERTELQADPALLEQVLINLIKNGMEACRHVTGACVEVVAYHDEQDRNSLRIEVQDNGPGIPDDVLDKIFIPFYTTKKQGSGIGLSLSKQIMGQHGGSLRVQTGPGGPTKFTLQFKYSAV